MLFPDEAWESALHRLIVFIAFVALIITLPGVAQAQKRVALVIGNGNYTGVSPLANPPNDARLMAGTLRSLGFEVIEKIDASQKSMKRAVRAFGDLLEAGGDDAVGLFYYAGHGVQVKGANYIIPVDAQIIKEGDVSIESIDANDVLSMMEHSGAGLNFVILDACRNNPFLSSNRSGSRGLAEMNAPTGSFIAYATSPGDVAADGDGVNSPYTTALSNAMLEPGIAVERMFRKVRNNVRSATNNDQTPWESSSLIGEDFFFNPAGAQATKTPAVTQQNNLTPETIFWQSIQGSADASLFEAYLSQYPNGTFNAIAKIKMKILNRSQVAAIDPTQDANQSVSGRAPITDCDRLAAHPYDPDKVGLGVKWNNLVAGTAIRACEQALKQYPDEMRFVYQLGRSNNKDGNYNRTLTYLREAAAGNYVTAFSAIGVMYDNGEGVAENDAEAIRWYRKGAEQGYARAQYLLGTMYENGEGVTENDTEATGWYRKAAEQGYARAQHYLGTMYDFGKGVTENDTEAVRWYRKAAEQGYARAQYNLGVMYYNGKGVAENDTEAIRWYRKAAEQGYARAQYNLGTMYENGEGVAENNTEALRWYRKAAEQGQASAQYNIGTMYKNGKGVAENDTEAAGWYRKAAEQGNAAAQNNLGTMYYNGEGVKKNKSKAKQWLRKAADQGYKMAQDNLKLFE